MTELVGLLSQRVDTVDAHRWDAYHDFFNLAMGVDRPLAVHWLLFTKLLRELRPDGHPVHMEPFPELPFPRRMWVGGEIAWLSPLAPGAELSRTTAVVRAEMKTGSSGSFLLASLQHSLSAASRSCITERQDIAFLPATRAPSAVIARPLSFEPEWNQSCRHSTIDLFRYSALTFNSHRIHYDEPYAKGVEGYPGLVVHGPLLATQAMQAAARRRPCHSAARFSYRSVAPVFVNENCTVVGRRGDSSDDVVILGEDGSPRFIATMSFQDPID